MSTPSLSILVPVYRKPAHVLERCVKAIQTQSLKSWEAIFVLDGEDAVAEATIHRLFKKVPQHYKLVTIEHGGACAARNEAFKHSQGKYVVFLDADVYLDVRTAEAWVEKLDENPDVAFVYNHYSFRGTNDAIPAEPFDPWLLKVRNYISGCNPVRREFVQTWRTELASLQDWCFWLDVVAAGGKGKLMDFYGWTTEPPDPESISGKGCSDDVWLERVRAVQKIHNLPERKVCVSSLGSKHDGISLAKAIDADYQDYPNAKANPYEVIIQVGFNMDPQRVEAHAAIFSNPGIKKFLFWTPDDINQIYNGCSFQAIVKYSELLNRVCINQFVEDEAARKLMEKAGFKVEVLPLPLSVDRDPKPLPDKPAFLVDTCGEYYHVFIALRRSLPDIDLKPLEGSANIDDYTGLIHFYLDRTTSPAMKRAQLSGRHVISNVQAPFAGFIDDLRGPEQFLPVMVEKIRAVAKKPLNTAGRDYWLKAAAAKKVLEAIA